MKAIAVFLNATRRLISKFVFKVNGILKHLYLWRLGGIIIFVFIFPLPNLFINNSYKIQLVPESSLSKSGQPVIDIGDSDLVSESFLTQLVGGKIKSSTISVCLENDTHPYPPNFSATSTSELEIISKVSDQLGALSIKVRNSSTNEMSEIYASRGTTTCRHFLGGNIRLKADDIEFNNLYYYGNLNGEDVSGGYVDLGSSKVVIRVLVNIKDYLYGVFVTLLGTGVLVQIFFSMKSFVTRSKSEKDR